MTIALTVGTDATDYGFTRYGYGAISPITIQGIEVVRLGTLSGADTLICSTVANNKFGYGDFFVFKFNAGGSSFKASMFWNGGQYVSQSMPGLLAALQAENKNTIFMNDVPNTSTAGSEFNPDHVPTGDNNKINPYYKKINNVKIAKQDSNKQTFDVGGGGEPPFDSGLIEGGGFETDEHWDFAAIPAWEYDAANEVARVPVPSAGNNAVLENTSFNPTIAQTYQVDYDLLDWGGVGRFQIVLGGAVGAWRTSSGSYTDLITPTTTGRLGLKENNDWVGAVNNVRVTESAVVQTEYGPFIVKSQSSAGTPYWLRSYSLDGKIFTDTWEVGFDVVKPISPDLWIPRDEFENNASIPQDVKDEVGAQVEEIENQ